MSKKYFGVKYFLVRWIQLKIQGMETYKTIIGSLRYNANLPEKLIQERPGHRSLKALRQYECMSESQLVEVSNIISSTFDKVQVPNYM